MKAKFLIPEIDKKRFAENEDRLNNKLREKGLPERTKIIDGPLVIFAAGNEGLDYSSYPGALMDCICVTGTGPAGYPPPPGYQRYVQSSRRYS